MARISQHAVRSGDRIPVRARFSAPVQSGSLPSLLFGCHPVAVVILHVYKTFTNKFKSGGLHEKHVVATWNVGNRLSVCL